MVKLTGKKLLLILLYSPTESGSVNVPIAGRTRLMKMGFLFEEELLQNFRRDRTIEIIESDLPKYFSWHYGPFSRDFLNDLEFLVNQAYIDRSFGRNAPTPEEIEEYNYWVEDMDDFEAREYQEEIFTLNAQRGLPKAKVIWDLLSDTQKSIIKDFKTILNKATLDRILEYVYKKYKDGYTDKSLIRDKYLS
ncbi:hypothetical protein ACFL37_02210 [Candidatus Margulisiibacteriota bacterium]